MCEYFRLALFLESLPPSWEEEEEEEEEEEGLWRLQWRWRGEGERAIMDIEFDAYLF